MKFPPKGTWCRVFWQDAQCEPKWSYDDDRDEPVIEVTAGLFRGINEEGLAIITPTASIEVDTGVMTGKLAEHGIPVGCITRIIKDPPIDLRMAKASLRPTRARKATT
jgi:hypothetical protein